jgi:putative DNA primase/helicase
VLYIDGEMSASAMQERLSLLIAGEEIEFDPENLKIITPDLQEGPMPNLSTERGQRAILPYVQDADLIVLDNLATLVPCNV